MMNDTVREELKPKITPAIVQRLEVTSAPLPERRLYAPRPVTPVIKRPITAGLASPKTSQTLVEFQNKNASLPDWRLQLQNAVQQRKGAQKITSDASATGIHVQTNGAAALEVGVVQRVEAEFAIEITDPRVANAMRRLSQSRKDFDTDGASKKAMHAKDAHVRPFGVVAPTSGPAAAPALARTIAPPKPKLVNPAPFAEKRDTNKLLPIEGSAAVVKAEAPTRGEDTFAISTEFAEIKRIHIRAEHREIETVVAPDIDSAEIEDLAPFSMRFGAGLFDLIIGAFAGMLILSPVAFTNGDWFTTAGLLTLAGICSIVMFLYLTLCLGFFGKTMGMRLFSLELVDAVENEYPTLRQAAVNSSIFLLSLVFGGAGFLTVFFNEENRALHDLLSGTIIVREF